MYVGMTTSDWAWRLTYSRLAVPTTGGFDGYADHGYQCSTVQPASALVQRSILPSSKVMTTARSTTFHWPGDWRSGSAAAAEPSLPTSHVWTTPLVNVIRHFPTGWS